MKITRQQLKKLIKEEMSRLKNEGRPEGTGAFGLGQPGQLPGLEKGMEKQGPLAREMVKIERKLMQASRMMPKGCPAPAGAFETTSYLYEEAKDMMLNLLRDIYSNHPEILQKGTEETSDDY